MILDRLDLTPDEFVHATGWEIRPEGACKDDVCVPLHGLEPSAEGRVDVEVLAERLAMPLAYDELHHLWSIGPRSGDRRVLDNTRMPDLVLHDFDDNAFDVASLRGRKVVLIAWASW